MANSYEHGTNQIGVQLDFTMIGQKICKTKVTIQETNSKPYKLPNLTVWIWKKGDICGERVAGSISGNYSMHRRNCK